MSDLLVILACVFISILIVLSLFTAVLAAGYIAFILTNNIVASVLTSLLALILLRKVIA